MPIILLVLLLADFLSVAFVVFDVYLFREWYQWKDTVDEEYARRCLYGAIALAGWMLVGKTPLSWLVSKRRRGEDDPKPERSSRRDRIKRPDGTVINVEYFGNDAADPILFVHGWNANSTEWYYQKKHFSKTNRVVLIDLPGLGKSTWPDNKDFSLQKMASDLEAVIEHLGLKRLVLWGHSIGGMVILTYCLQIGRTVEQHVRGIVLQHTTFTDPVQTSILSRLLTTIEKPILRPICYIMIALSPIFWLSKWMSYMNGNLLLSTRFLTFAGTQTHGQLDFISRLSAMAPPSVFARGMLGMLKTYDVHNDLQNLRIPALILAAKSDKLTKPEASEYMHRRIPSSQLVTLAPAGHQGLVERHTESNSAAEAFIGGLT